MKISNLFNLLYGQRELTSKQNLREGSTIIISSQGVDNGCYGFYDFPAKYSPPFITVPRTGSIGKAFVQEYSCSVTDDLILLLPKKKLEIEFLYYVVVLIRSQKWRYNYGRKITPKRLGKIEIDMSGYNLKKIKEYRKRILEKAQKANDIKRKIYSGKKKKKKFRLYQLMDIIYGQHEINSKEFLRLGNNIVVSSQRSDNGCYGFFDIATFFKKPVISVPRTGSIGFAFVQEYSCCIDDNCLVLIPKESFKLSIEELYFIAAIVRLDSWRYRYGRQVTEKRVGQLEIDFSLMDYDKVYSLRDSLRVAST